MAQETPQSQLPEQQPADPRVVLAAERTLLAWIRTGLAMMGFGFIVARFGIFLREIAQSHGAEAQGSFSVRGGTALVVCGVLATALGMWDHVRVIRRIRANEDLSRRWAPGIVISLLVCVFGLALAMYLMMR